MSAGKPDGSASGKGLSEADCKKLKDGFKKHKATPIPSLGQIISAMYQWSVAAIVDVVTDAVNVVGTLSDLLDADIRIDNDAVDPATNAVTVDLNVNAQVGATTPSTIYRIRLDFQGDGIYDAMIEEHFTSPDTGHAVFQPITYAGVAQPLPLEIADRFLSGEGPYEGFLAPAGTRLTVTVPMGLLQALGPAPVFFITSELAGVEKDFLGPEPVPTIDNEPEVTIAPLEAMSYGIAAVI